MKIEANKIKNHFSDDVLNMKWNQFEKNSWFQTELFRNNLVFGHAAAIMLVTISLIGFVGTYAPFSEGLVVSYINATFVYAVLLVFNLFSLILLNRRARAFREDESKTSHRIFYWFNAINMVLAATTCLATQKHSGFFFEYILTTVIVYLLLYLDMRSQIRNMIINLLSIVLILEISHHNTAWQDIVDIIALHVICLFINRIRYKNFVLLEQNKYLIEKQKMEFYLDSRKDGLTGLSNRMSLREDFDGYIGKDLCFAMIDLDLFKQFNDVFGHAVGDKALIATGHFMQKIFDRETDHCYRYGGDEFLIVSETKDFSDFQDRLGQLSNKCRNWKGIRKISLSIGFTYGHTKGLVEIREMLELADENLYLAKSGKPDKIIGSRFVSKAEKTDL